jgi:adenylylsulfate kinase-like enzyme
MDRTDRIAHLNMIQRTIDRMAGESAQIKSFALAATVAVISTAGATENSAVAFAGLALIAVFWCMDAQYLAQERWFRELYGKALKAKVDNFVMTPSPDIRKANGLRQTLFGWSTVPLYGALAILCLTLALWIVLS